VKRLAVLGLIVGFAAAACGGRGAASLGAAPGASPSESSSPAKGTPSASRPPTSPSPSPSASMTYEVWFQLGEHLFVTKRTQPFTPGVGSAALTALIAGPSSSERAAGVGLSVPSGTALLGLNIAKGLATVDLSAGFASGGGTLSEQMRLAQVVYTLTQFATVSGVNFRLDGQPVTVFSGQGIVLDHPQTRNDFEDLLPAILVEGPLVGQTVGNPVTVAGSANVFEATVTVRILDSKGHEIARTFTTATCGTGCRGDYSVQVDYSVSSTQPGTIEVFESSAEDGSPINVVDIPVTLTV
jgi:immunoglobulin-like protein involved in spore germination/sporulation and spore germination protein